MADLPDYALALLTFNGQPVSFERGAIVLRPGVVNRPAIVTAGRLRLFIQDGDGRQATVHYDGPGDAVGVAHYFDPDIPLTIQALTEAQLVHFDGSVLEDLMGRDARVARAVAAMLADSLAASTIQMRYQVFGSARLRLAAHLLTLAEPDGSGRLVARVGQQELADAVGSVREHVARVLREFRRLGMVTTTRTAVVILDAPALQAEAALE
ncbi:MAG TPA: Crp/Fnr family transcriptional regulator [Candidatus Dormibacteraeota bacterium]